MTKTKKQPSKINKVVGVGASAGGLDAIQQLFDHIPPDTDNSFVIIQHLSPDFKSLMPELLSKHTDMPIFTAEDKQNIEPNCIYLNLSTKNLHIKGKTLYLLDKGPKSNLNLPIDIFFHTLGEEFKENAVGIILSGTGSDGSNGIKSIKEGGGLLFVQSPETAQFDGMPNAALATELIDFVLSPQEIGESIGKYASQDFHNLLSSITSASQDEVYHQILQEVYKYSGLDLKLYKNNTLLRRLEKRLNINNFTNLSDYYYFLRSNEEEKKYLFQDFLIGVTNFFRDQEAFEFIKKEIIPLLCDPTKRTGPVRVWIPGCSTGEEAYSFAILFDQYIVGHNLDLDYKIFATDISEPALNKASSGLFHINAIQEIPDVITKNYFIKTGDQIQIIKRVRDKIVFSVHNVLKDPPFIRMDLISCRNLLIYLRNEAQNKVISHALFSLNNQSYLFLGASESLGKYEKDFRALNNKWKIFQRTSIAQNRIEDFETPKRVSEPFKTKDFNQYQPPKRDSELLYYKYISDEYGPSLIFIDNNFNILFLKGNVGYKLSPKEGLFQQNIIQLVDSSLASVIRNGIRRVRSENKTILIKDVFIQNDSNGLLIDLSFKKAALTESTNELFVIEFGEDRILDDKLEIDNINIEEVAAQRIEDLEYELKIKNEDLLNAIEELETTNEELQSANEELMASNEELQSTNEELHSVNEELYTVNSELQEKNKELAGANDLINNLINSTEIATLFLDKELKIRKFTNSLKRNLALEPTDVGRSVFSFSFNFSYATSQILIAEAQKCLETKQPFEKQITDTSGYSYLLRINPFINHHETLDGVVITLVDITELISTREELRQMEDKYIKLFHNIKVGVIHGEIITDTTNTPIDLKVISINPEFEAQIGGSLVELEGDRLSDLIQDPEIGSILNILNLSTKNGTPHNIRYYSPTFNKHYIVRSFSPKKGECAATFEDITELVKNKEILKKTIERLNMAIDLTDMAIWEWDVENNEIIEKNKYWENLYRLGKESNVTEAFYNKIYKDDKEKVSSDINSLVADKINSYHHEFRYIDDQSNKIKWVVNVGQTFQRDTNGKAKSVLGVSRDITKEKEAYFKLEEEKLFNQSIAENSTSGIYIYNLKLGSNTYMNQRYAEILGWTMEEINQMDAPTFFNLFHPEDQDAIQKHMDIIINDKKEDQIKYRFKHKKGHWVTCFSVDAPLDFDEEGKVVAFIGSFIDVSELE